MIVANQVQLLLSAPAASAGYTMPGVVGNSLGKFASTSQLSMTELDAFFPDLTGAQNAGDQVDYQCLFIYNSNTADSMLNPILWMPISLLGSGNTATFAVAADTYSPSALLSGSQQALSIGSTTQAPSGVSTWYAPTSTPVGGLPLSNILPLYTAAVWFRRTANGVGSLNQLGIDITFDSQP
jgi:hypothetical protein